MISISKFSDTQYMTSHINQIFDDMNDSLYPVNTYFAHFFRTKDLNSLKSILAHSPSSVFTVQTYRALEANLLSSEKELANTFIQNTLFDSDRMYFYLGSKNSFKLNHFSHFLPSAFNHFFNHLIENNFAKVIGPGHGSYIVFDLSKPLPVPSSQEQSFQDNIASFVNSYNAIKSDNAYLLELASYKDGIIHSLQSKIEELQDQNYITSQITWR